ncbi:MAG: 50S ribosomal protein L17 [Candidatus Harrisonbacteria bacterium]|nr:50S ribosomal protein L17 [Candidatus Harrisonbacteria bacterium]
MALVKKFHRKKGMRRSFIRNLAVNLIMHGKMKTTEDRARFVRPLFERLVTITRRNRVSDLRLAISRLNSKEAAEKLFYEIAPKYKERNGGYTRIVKLGERRKRDAAKLAVIELVK